jgi:rhodanese-related sulfurtransferase
MVIQETENDPDDWMIALLRSPIFQRLPPANLQKILMGLEEVRFNKGETIIEQGCAGDYYYLIKNGQCLLTRKPSPNAKDIKLAQLASGDTFGEDSLISGAPRNVTITALTDIVLLRLDKKQFVSLIKEPSLRFVDYVEMQEAVEQQGAVLLDVRSQDEYADYHLDDTVNAPFFSLRMQLKTLTREKPVIVVCADGKVSEAAAFLLLRHKIDALILKGGMKGVLPETKLEAEPENEAAIFRIDDGFETLAGNQENVSEQSVASSFEDQIRLLNSENEELKRMNAQLNDKCAQLEADKEYGEKQRKILHNQVEKLTQVLDGLERD